MSLNQDPVGDGEQGVFLIIDAVLDDRPRRVVLLFQGGIRGLKCSQRLGDCGLELVLHDGRVGPSPELFQFGFCFGYGAFAWSCFTVASRRASSCPPLALV